MPKALPFREAVPISLEEVVRHSSLVQPGPGFGTIDMANTNTMCLLPGEPLWKFNRIWFTEKVILPGHMFSAHTGQVRDFLLNSDEAEEIAEGDNVYFDYDLADEDAGVVGYASSQQPTNGLLLGIALCKPYDRAAMPTDYSGDPLASSPGSRTVRVLVFSTTGTKWGTVPTI